MQRWRDAKADKPDNDTGETHSPSIKTTPRSTKEQETILNEVQKDLYSDDRESWTNTDIEARIAAKVPKQSSTVLLEQLVKSSRIAYITATKRYIIENPNIEAQ